MGEELGVEHGRDPGGAIVDDRQRRHAAGGDAQDLLEQFGPPEREAGGTKQLGEPVEVDPLLVEAGDSQSRSFLSLRNRFLQWRQE